MFRIRERTVGPRGLRNCMWSSFGVDQVIAGLEMDFEVRIEVKCAILLHA